MAGDAGGGRPWQPLAAELTGTALLVLVGLSLVIVMFGAGSPMPQSSRTTRCAGSSPAFCSARPAR